MAAGKYTITIEQGATTDFEVQWKDSTGSPVDLTNYQARMQIRSDYGGTLYATLSSSRASDGTGLNMSGSNGTTPPTSGSVGVFISAASSSAFTFSEGRYDLEMVSGSGANEYVTRLLEGKVKLSKNITV
tara:strand:+ start:1281 stop:1670 length:390 start_codon:yes stop_codon:yes gene_type:complete